MANFSIEYNNLIIDHESKYKLSVVDGLFNIPLITSSDKFTGYDGGQVWEQSYDMRIINFVGRIVTSNKTDFYNAIRDLSSAFSRQSTALPLLITLETGETKTINAKVMSMPDIVLDTEAPNTARFRMAVICEDPLFYDDVLQSVEVELITGGGGYVPTPVPMSLASGVGGSVVINNSGVDTYANFIITGGIPDATVTNSSYDESFNISTAISSAETITINRNSGSLTVVSDLNGNYFPYFSGTAFKLRSGNNTIEFSSSGYDADAQLVVQWYNKELTP